jgi:hypothetical protein
LGSWWLASNRKVFDRVHISHPPTAVSLNPKKAAHHLEPPLAKEDRQGNRTECDQRETKGVCQGRDQIAPVHAGVAVTATKAVIDEAIGQTRHAE